MSAPATVFIHHADQIKCDGTQCLVFTSDAPVNIRDTQTQYVNASNPQALAQALLDLWQPANVQQMTYPDSVPFRRYLNEIIKQGK